MCKFKRCRLFVLLLAAVLLIPFVPHPAARAEENEDGRTVIGREDHAFVELPGFIKPAEPSINSYTGILVELNSGTILYAKNINQRMFPASITKVMTITVAMTTPPTMSPMMGPLLEPTSSAKNTLKTNQGKGL